MTDDDRGFQVGPGERWTPDKEYGTTDMWMAAEMEGIPGRPGDALDIQRARRDLEDVHGAWDLLAFAEMEESGRLRQLVDAATTDRERIEALAALAASEKRCTIYGKLAGLV